MNVVNFQDLGLNTPIYAETTIELQVICPPLEFVENFVESLQCTKKAPQAKILVDCRKF